MFRMHSITEDVWNGPGMGHLSPVRQIRQIQDDTETEEYTVEVLHGRRFLSPPRQIQDDTNTEELTVGLELRYTLYTN